MSMWLELVEVEDDTKESLMKALFFLGQGDADFNGDNGIAYLWDVVWTANGFAHYGDWIAQGNPEVKYESNLEYLCDELMKVEDNRKCISMFFEAWLGEDDYYKDYHYEILGTYENITAIALAYEY